MMRMGKRDEDGCVGERIEMGKVMELGIER